MEGAYGVAMVKATNLDIVAPKEKHVRFLIQWTNEHCDPDKAEELPAVFRCLVARLEEKVTFALHVSASGLHSLPHCLAKLTVPQLAGLCDCH
jgi:hypothetical protein